ncbi:hypothetical protein ACR6A7_14745 [Pantoea sp. RRHST58]
MGQGDAHCPINPIEINPCALDDENGDFCGAVSHYRMVFQQLSALSGGGHSLGPPDVRPLRYHLHSEILGTVFPDADLDEVTAGIAILFHCLR